MKKLNLLLTLTFLTVVINKFYAQKTCDDAISLPDVSNYCSPQKNYTNSGITPSTFSLPSCWTDNTAKQDIWFKFTSVGTDVSVTIAGGTGVDGTIKKPSLALMTECVGNTNAKEIRCVNGVRDTTLLYNGGLTAGQVYYIRVSSSVANAGTFKLCIDSYTPPPNPAADCDNKVKLCDKNQVHVPALSGAGTKSNEINLSENSCLYSGEHNSCWYYWQCDTAGTLTFDLVPDTPETDLDFALFSGSTEAELCKPKIGSDGRTSERSSCTTCKAGNTGLNTTSKASDVRENYDCTAGDDGYVSQLNMVAGRYYALLIDNASDKDGFTINFGGTGTFMGAKAQIKADKVVICEGNTIKFDGSTSRGYDAGKLEWTFTGGTPATGNGAVSYDVTYDTPGNYVAILKVTGGKCVSTDYVNITVNAGATVSVAPKEVCENGEVTLAAVPSVIGGTYKWTPTPASGSSKDSTITVSPTTNTTYTVVYSLAGCDAVGLGVVTVNKKPEVTVNSGSICPGDSLELTASLKETVGTYTYDWAPGITSQKQTITVSPTTKTTYTVIVKSGDGCLDTTTATVDINGILNVDAGKDTTICKDGTIQLLVKPNGAGYTYKWTASNSTVLSDPAIYNPTAVINTATTFSVHVVSDKGCVGDSTITVSIDPDLNASLTTSSVSCSVCDGKITADVSGGTEPYNYSWTGSGGCNAATCENLCQGSYTLTITDKIGCTISVDTSLVAPPNITLQTSTIQSTCGLSNGSATVVASDGSGGFTYEWNDKNKQTKATASNLPAGKYCVTVTDSSGCKQTACVDIVDKPGFTAKITAVTKTSCHGVCDGTAEVTVTGAYGPVSYSWNTTPGSQTNFKATGLCAEDYIVTIKDSAGCQDTLHVKILQPTKVVLDSVPVVKLCIGSSATLNAIAHGGDGKYFYSWTELPDTTASVLVAPTKNTDYHVTVRDGNGCMSDPLTIKVVVNPPLKVSVSGKTLLCEGDSTKLTAIGNGGNGGPYTYTWAPAISAISSSVTIAPSTTKTVTVTVKDECGTPTATDTIRIVVNAMPQIVFTGDTLQGCDPLSVDFNSDSTKVIGGIIKDWKWDFGDGGKSDSKNPTHVFQAKDGKTTLYSIKLTVTSDNGCVNALTKKDYVRVFPVPVPGFEIPLSVSIVNPTVHFINTSAGATMWEWDFGDSLSSHSDNISSVYSPTHTYSEIGTYWIKQVAKNYGGCKDSTIRPIRIDPKFVLYIPNAFTPNGDGDNDTFFAKGEYINEFEMRIFDRWGNMVFYSDSIDKGWNGKINNTVGEICQNDVYVYQIRIKDNFNKTHKYVGKVTLLQGK